MRDAKLDKFLADLRERLRDDPAFHDGFTGSIELSLLHGGLSGNMKIITINQPRKDNRER
jgi:hypothetical protein